MENTWKLKVLRILRQQIYFFNANGVYTSVSKQKAQRLKLEGLKYDYIQRWYYCTDRIGPEARAIACLKIGDTIEKLEKDICRFKKIDSETEKNLKMTNTVYRVFRSNLYYFNNEGIYTCERIEEVLQKDIAIKEVKIAKGRNVITCLPYSPICLKEMLEIREYHVFRRAFGKMKPGDTIENLKEYCNSDVEYAKKTKREGVQRFITKVQKPKFVCEHGNQNKDNAYDYISVDVNIISEWKTDKETYIKEHVREIGKAILEEVATKKLFLEYEIPAFEQLQIKDVTLNEEINVLYYTFKVIK